MEEEAVVGKRSFDEVGKGLQQKDGVLSSSADKHEMFEGKNIHSSPVDGKPLCSFSQKMCMQRRLNGFAFCIRHILEDKHAPFKQCQYVTKYNGNQCINPVPVAEERIYCNSHLQVLGLAPKKTKRKLISLDSALDGPSISKQDNQSEKRSTDGTVKEKVKENTKGCSSEKRLDIKSNTAYATSALVAPWNPCAQIWGHVRKRRKASGCKFTGNVNFDEVEGFKKVTKECSSGLLPIFKRYMFYTEETERLQTTPPVYQSCFEAEEVSNNITPLQLDMLLSERRRYQMLQLNHQRAQLKLEIHEKLTKPELSYSVLSSLVLSARKNAAATANVLIGSSRGNKPFRVRKVTSSKITCYHKTGEKICRQRALPFSRYCSDHIGRDTVQVLFGKCTAKFPVGTSCAVPVVDFVNERPLCQEHARKRAESIKCTAKTPPKKTRKGPTEDEQEKEKEKLVKQTLNKKNLKARLQKRFAIPGKPSKKLTIPSKGVTVKTSQESLQSSSSAESYHNSHSFGEDYKNEVRNKRRAKLREIAQRETLSKANAAKRANLLRNDRKEHIVKPPPDSPFDIQDDSLSSPSMSPTYEMDEMGSDFSRGTLLGMDCNHTDSFDPEDEEMNLQLSKNSILAKSARQTTRQITSPTLNQLSIDSFGRKESLSSLTSPKRFPFTGSTPLSPPQARRLSSPLKLDGSDLPFSTGITVGGRVTDGLGGDSRLSTPSSIASNGEDDRYVLENVEQGTRLPQSRLRVISPPTEFTLGKPSPSKSVWTTKFTLPTRTDMALPSGFIRMSPSSSSSPSNPSVYSPPFGVTGSPRSKGQVFRFDASAGYYQTTDSKQVDFSSSKDSVFVPIQERILLMDKRQDKEPPIEKVNPDIFFSPAAFSSTPSSAS